ncbi:uncharacterized protein LOC127243361 [Andrographis paniculata]|uniref:uncharacterized protein LOC127243361 n=1 Tax=Andrographis paniculata TaxID=175694 RepID=UPI0021E72445|nr:uncharacterized protein LOC127243361 [Andrographis paniculata]
MATTRSIIVAQALPAQPSPQAANAAKNAGMVGIPSRRQCLVLLTSVAGMKAMEMPSRAKDIPLFGLRQGLRKAEQEAELIVKEGFETADKGIVAAEKGVVAAEKGVEAAEKEIETILSFGGLAQAGVVAAAEVLGLLIATAVVNGILGPEAQKS